jgi:hypothetical protein
MQYKWKSVNRFVINDIVTVRRLCAQTDLYWTPVISKPSRMQLIVNALDWCKESMNHILIKQSCL